MSIQSEITRISGNVADALTAIAAKGVTVPQGANSDDLADLIGSIASDLTTKTITLNGSYSAQDDNADGYSAVTVNVANGASMTEVANTYGTELVITSAPGSAPSATRHTLYFEFEDETTETEYAYYDDSFISSAITATTPATRGSKTVTSAQLDGVEWYSYTPAPTPSGDWTVLYDGNIELWDGETIIEDLVGMTISAGETYRVTLDGTAYISETAQHSQWGVYYFGNVNLWDDTDDGTGLPFVCYENQWGLKIEIRNGGNATYSFKLEKLVST